MVDSVGWQVGGSPCVDVVGCPAGCLVDLDTTIAIAIVFTHAVGHAVDLGKRGSEELVPLAVKGDDDWVCYDSS